MNMMRQRPNRPWLTSAVIVTGWWAFDATLHVALSDPPSRARIGVDDDSVRPLAQIGRPRVSPPRLPKPTLPKGRIGVDDDSVRPVFPKREPPVRR
jgi:hypothetical protein